MCVARNCRSTRLAASCCQPALWPPGSCNSGSRGPGRKPSSQSSPLWHLKPFQGRGCSGNWWLVSETSFHYKFPVTNFEFPLHAISGFPLQVSRISHFQFPVTKIEFPVTGFKVIFSFPLQTKSFPLQTFSETRYEFPFSVKRDKTGSTKKTGRTRRMNLWKGSRDPTHAKRTDRQNKTDESKFHGFCEAN